MDQQEIMKRELNMSEKYCNWRSGSDLRNAHQEKNLPNRKNDGPMKLVLQIKEIEDVTDSSWIYSRQKSLTNSEFSLTSSQCSQSSPRPTQRKKSIYWSMSRGK